jgi:hypothetical protein
MGSAELFLMVELAVMEAILVLLAHLGVELLVALVVAIKAQTNFQAVAVVVQETQ